MTKALILLTLEPGVGNKPLKNVKKVSGVIESEMLYGPYDAYVLIEAEDSQTLQDIVIGNVRNIDGIESTLTCFVAS